MFLKKTPCKLGVR